MGAFFGKGWPGCSLLKWKYSSLDCSCLLRLKNLATCFLCSFKMMPISLENSLLGCVTASAIFSCCIMGRKTQGYRSKLGAGAAARKMTRGAGLRGKVRSHFLASLLPPCSRHCAPPSEDQPCLRAADGNPLPTMTLTLSFRAPSGWLDRLGSLIPIAVLTSGLQPGFPPPSAHAPLCCAPASPDFMQG